MKRAITYTILILCLNLSCKSSQSKTQLLAKNKALKEKISSLESYDSINKDAALELKNMNVVYRGVSNPIYISKPNAVSFEASAPGLKKIDNNGSYTLSPQTGSSVNIEIKSVLKSGDTITQYKKLRINHLGRLVAKINTLGCGIKCIVLMKKEKLFNSKINIESVGVLFDWKFEIKSFKIHLLSQKKIIDVEGNKISSKIIGELESLKTNDIIHIFNFKFSSNANIYAKNPGPIIIQIVD